MEDQCDAAVDYGMKPCAEPQPFDVNWFEDYVLPKPRPTYSYFGSGLEWKPQNTLYAPHSRRLISFDNWPKQMHPTPIDLATAGFYYLGSGDSVRCFHCGIGVHDWEPEDTAMGEHKRLSPTCKYLEMISST